MFILVLEERKVQLTMLIKDYNAPFLKAFYGRCVALNLRTSSIIQYNKTLKRFLAVYRADECNADDIRCFLIKKEVSPVTRKIYWMTLNVFYNFLYKNGYIKVNPMETVEKPKVPRKIQRFFSTEEIEAILNCWDDSYTGVRNKTIMLLFLGTGIRRAEAADLKVTDIRFDLDLIFIKGKGGKERFIPLTAELRKILNRYLIKRKKVNSGSKSLFLNSVTGEGLTPAGIWSVFKNSPLTGERVSPHTWRRTFSRIFLKNGGDLVTLQMLLGHSDISTTRKYITLTAEDLTEINNRFNPLSNKRWRFY